MVLCVHNAYLVKEFQEQCQKKYVKIFFCVVCHHSIYNFRLSSLEASQAVINANNKSL